MLASVQTDKQLNLPIYLVFSKGSGIVRFLGKAIATKLIPPKIPNLALEYAFWKLTNTQPQNNLTLYMHGCAKRKCLVNGIRVRYEEIKRGAWYEL